MVTKVSSANFSTTLISSLTGPTITGIQYLDNSYNVLPETAMPLNGGYIYVNGTGFVSGCQVTVDGTLCSSISFISSTQLRVLVPAMTSGTYPIYVINPSGNIAIKVFGINYALAPYWISGQTFSQNAGVVNIQLSAASADATTFTVTSGYSLPSGLTLSSGGLLSGVVSPSVDTTYTFSVTATDNELQATAQTFSITLITSDPYFNYTALLLNGETTLTPHITDASTNNFALATVGNTKATPFSPYYGDGYYSNLFDGSTGNLTISYNTNLNLGSVGSWTIETWGFVANATFGTYTPVSFYQDGTNRWDLEISSTTTNVLYNNTTSKVFTNPITLSTNQWYHFAFTRDGSTVRMFINGIASPTTDTNNFNSLSSGTFYIGSNNLPGYPQYSFWWAGYLSNLRLIKGQALYTANFTPSTTSLTSVANTALLTCQSTSIVDKSANNLAITKNGTVNITPATPFTTPTSVTVNTGYSVLFNGSTDYVKLPTSYAGAQMGSSDFTVECWVFPTTQTNPGRIVNNWNSSVGQSSSASWEILLAGTGIQFLCSTNGTSSQVSITTGSAPTGTWTHIAAVRIGNVFTLYCNGVSAGTATQSITLETADATTFGARNNGGTYAEFFAGYISNLRIIKGTGIYTGAFTPSTSPLTAITNTTLLTCQGNAIIDASTNAATLTINGTPKVLNNTYPFTQTTSTVSNLSNLGTTYFNGSSDTINLPSSTVLPGSGNFTFEFWVNIPTAPTGGAYYTCFAYGSTGSVLRCFVYNNSGNYFGIWIGATQVINVASTAMIGQWAHIALVRNGTTLTAYINGLSVGTYSDSTNYNTGQLYIGSQAATNYLAGYISDFRVVVGSALYTNTFAPTYQPLAAVTNTSLLTLQYNGNSTNNGIIDNSTFQNVITRNGSPSLGNFSPYSQNGWSVYFNGTSNSAGSSLSGTLSTTIGSSNFTLEGWVYHTALYNYMDWFSITRGTTGFNVGVDSTGTVVMYYNSNRQIASSSGVITANTWYHFAYVRNGTTITAYINGTSVGSTTTTTNSNFTASGFFIGSLDNTQEFVPGYISNLRLVVGTAVYNSTFTPSTTPLLTVTNTQLLTCQSNRFVDNSANASAFTITGTPSIQAFSPFQSMNVIPTYYSTYFGGSGNYLTITGASIPATQTTFTIECFIYMTQLPTSTTGNSSPLIGDFTPTSTSDYWAFGPIASGVLSFYWYDGAIKTVTGNTVMSINTWYHIALSVNSSSISLYVNGVAQTLTGTTTLTNRTGTLSSLYMGQFNSTTNIYYGYVSSLRILNTTALYSSSFVIPTSPLTAIATTLLLTCQTNKIVDLSTNSYAITSTGTIRVATINPFGSQYTITTPVAYNPSINGGSCYFNGTTDYLTVPSTTTLQGIANRNMTIEFWVNFSSTWSNTNYNLIQKGRTGTSDYEWGVYLTGSASGGTAGVISWQPQSGGSGTSNGTYNSSTVNIYASTWNHIAISVSGTTVYFFLNGVAAGTASVTLSSFTGAGTLSVANNNNGSNAYFPGYISDVRVTPNVAIYTNTFFPPVAPLTSAPTTISQPSNLLLNFNNGAIVDAHGSGDLVTVSGTQLSTTIKKFGNNSLYFTGSSYAYVASTITNPIYAFGSNNFTIEFWVYFVSVSTTMQIIDSRPAGTSALTNYFYIALQSGTINYYTSSGQVITGSTPTAGTWYHVAVARYSGNTKLFVNGTQAGSTYGDTVTYNGAVNRPILGVDGNAVNTSYLNGYIDDLRITPGVARYTSNFTAPTTYVPYK